MPRKINDLTGKAFSYLTIVSLNERRNGKTYWNCKCFCGNEVVRDVGSLTSKRSQIKTCGCFRKDFSGQKFGYLEILKIVNHGGLFWLAKCDCGNEVKLPISKFIKRTSCGCRNNESKVIHGHARRSHKNGQTKLYTTWIALKDRCFNPNNQAFQYYGGRGITVCERWLDFNKFAEDMGDPPNSKVSIDRIDTDLGYSPENCRWASNKTQVVNKRGKVRKASSRYKGVVRFSETKWRARITVDKKLLCLGLYDSEESAALAYNKKALQVWGDDAYLNKVFD